MAEVLRAGATEAVKVITAVLRPPTMVETEEPCKSHPDEMS